MARATWKMWSKGPVASRRWALTGLAVLAAAAVIGAPMVWTSMGTREATACLARWRAPRDTAGPDCSSAIGWFVRPSKIPWTRAPAAYRAEEVAARGAVEAYMDAAIGRPDRAALARTGAQLEVSHAAMQAGSKRVDLQELGPAICAPDLGYYAYLVGDRATLVDKAEAWTDFKPRLRALEAAVEAGEQARALAIAKSYAAKDPHEDDLRYALAAELCLAGDDKGGVELLEYLQSDRAGVRHEDFARDFGDVRYLMVACANHGGLAPLQKPRDPDAGRLDEPEARAVQRLRALATNKGPDDPDVKQAAQEGVALLLDNERVVASRAALVAAVLASGVPMSADEIAGLARASKASEAPFARVFRSPYDWLEERRGVLPLPGARAFADAAARVAEASEQAEGPAKESLNAIAWALRLEGARAALGEGDAAGGLEALKAAAPGFSGGAARQLATATFLYAARRAKDALAHVEPSRDEAVTPADKKRARVLRAELLASLGQRDAAAPIAEEADAIGPTDDPAADVRARWVRLALGKQPLRAAPSAPISSHDLARKLAWPAVALFGAERPWIAPVVEAQGDLDRALAMWDAARAAAPADQLAIRYALVERRGEVPRARVPFLAVGASILPSAGGDAEVWIDTLFAVDGRQLPMRTNAWVRAEVARWRGAAAVGDRWDARGAALTTAFARAPEIASALGM